MREWTAVAVAVRREEQREGVQEALEYLRRCRLFSPSTQLLVVVDAVDQSGSAGSALNALLVTAEHLCARRGFSVLNDDVIQEASILILLMGESTEESPLGWAFAPSTERVEVDGCRVRGMRLVQQIREVEALVHASSAGVWISSTESTWRLSSSSPPPLPSPSSISAFCCRVDKELASRHGVYHINDQGRIVSLSFRDAREGGDGVPPLLILGLLFLPPPVVTQFLVLASTYPVSRATYHGEDSGAIGLRLSLFFDMVQATCSSLDEFVGDTTAPEKIDTVHCAELREARRAIHRRLGGIPTLAVILDVTDYDYVPPSFLHCKGDSAVMTPTEYLKELDDAFAHDLHFEFLKCLRCEATAVGQKFPRGLLPILRGIVAIGDSETFIRETFLQYFITGKEDTMSNAAWSRVAASVGEALFLLAGGLGGLRCGPASNEAFHGGLTAIGEGNNQRGVASLIDTAREKWMDTPTRKVRAARHFEAAAQLIIRQRVMDVCKELLVPGWDSLPFPPSSSPPSRVSISMAARIDLFGGWLDTPPITLDVPAGVLNMAITIDGEFPLRCTVEAVATNGVEVVLDDGRMMLDEDSIWHRHNKPFLQGALVCACLIGSGLLPRRDSSIASSLARRRVPGRGLRLSLHSSLAHGSGLGSSSILAAATLRALWTLAGIDNDDQTLVHTVLHIEQLLTTGGGWQDQVGGVFPGLKMGRFERDEEGRQRISLEEVTVTRKMEEEIGGRLVLIFTGQPRLAKNLLQEVVRSWLLQTGESTRVLKEMSEEVERWKEWVHGDSFPVEHIRQYYAAKKVLATGCEPDAVSRLIQSVSSLSSLCWLVGAGGGGYLCVWLNEGRRAEEVEECLRGGEFGHLRVQRVALSQQPVNIDVQY